MSAPPSLQEIRSLVDIPVVGYGTTRVYILPSGTHPDSAVDFYRRALAGRWTEVAGSHEYVSLNAGGGRAAAGA